MKTLSYSKANARSHVGPIQEHLFLAGGVVNHLVAFFEVALAGDWKRARELQLCISKMEDRSQKLKKRLRLALPRHLILSELCAELIDLLALQTDLATRARNIALLVFARRMEFPSQIQDCLITLVQTTVMVSEQNLRVVDEFDRCLAQQLQQEACDLVVDLVRELDRLERSTDQLAIAIRGKLFKLETELEAVELVLLHRLVDSITDLAERSQTVGSRIQLLLN